MIRVFKKKSGFSLVELIIVCVLISVLVAIGSAAYLNSRREADKQKAIFNLYAIYQAQNMYFFDQEPQEYANAIGLLTPDYATISEDDGTWEYLITNFSGAPGSTFIATARQKLPDGTFDGFSLDIDQTGTIDEANWPY